MQRCLLGVNAEVGVIVGKFVVNEVFFYFVPLQVAIRIFKGPVEGLLLVLVVCGARGQLCFTEGSYALRLVPDVLHLDFKKLLFRKGGSTCNFCGAFTSW